MAIKIPAIYSGKPIKGAIEIILASNSPPSVKTKKKSRNTSQIVPSSSNLTNPENYILLEAKQHGSYSYPNMLVSMEKSHMGKNWTKTHEDLAKEGNYMLTIRQFVDFLSLLKSRRAFDGTGKLINRGKLESVFDEIVKVRDPWRSEWLDTRFEGSNIIYHTFNFNGGGNLVEVNEHLVNYIKTDKTPGINFNDWLKKANYQGLPTPKTKKGSLYYWTPVDGAVARFDASSGRAYLGCDGNASGTYSSLGVRAARPKN